MKALKTSVSLILSFLIVISVFFVVPFSVYGAEINYALSYNVGPYVFNTNTDGTATANFDGKTLYYSDDFDDNSIGSKLPKLDNQNVVYELHNSRITNVYTIPEVITPKVTVSHSVKDGIVYRNGKFSQNSFDLNVSVKPELSEKYQKDDLLWFLSNDEKNRLYATLTKLEIQPSGGVDFGSSGWWLWKDYQTNISENFNDRIKVNESKDYKYTVNLQNDKAVSQSEYNIEIYTTPTFDFGSGTRQTSKIRVGNLDYQGDRAEEKKLNSVSGKAVTQASSTLNGMSSAIQFSKNYLSSAQTKQVNRFVDLWLSELILAKYAHKSDLKEQVSDEVVKLFFKKLGVDMNILTLPGTIQATTYLQTKAQDGTSIFIEFTVKMMDFDFGDSGTPTMATGSGTATIYNMDGEKLDSSVILPAYADVCAFCTQLQKVAKSTILNGIDSYRTIFGINKEALAEALSSQIMAKILNNSNKKDYFSIIGSDTVRNALKKAIETSDSALTDKIFELAVTSSQKSTRVCVKCPVDVVVYDNDGKICGEVRNNVVDTSYNDVFISVVGDQKNIYLVGDDYSFKLVGTDTGKMDYDITEFDESGKEIRTISYKNLTLQDGCKYTSYVPEALNHSSKLFDLIDKDGNIISPTSGGDNLEVEEEDNAIQSGKCGDNVYYKFYNDGALKIYGSGEMDDYVQSDYYDEYPSYYRNPWENIKNSIKKVVIKDGITSIGANAFAHFSNLEIIDVPNSVGKICVGAFSYCSSIKSIIIPNNVIEIQRSAFYSCDNLLKINIPNNIKKIERYTFKNCKSLSEIMIGDSVELICESAFENCANISTITIPNSLKEVESLAFYNSKIDCVNTKDIYSWCKIVFNRYNSNPLSCGGKLYIDDTFSTSLTIPGNITSIGEYTFFGYKSLTNVTINNGVKSINESAFENCTGLINIVIPSSVENIDKSAFKKCTSLSKIQIPDSVKSIGRYAFCDCTNLLNVTIGKGIECIVDYLFYNCSKLSSVIVPDSVISIGDNAFNGCTNLASITIPDSVISIGDNAFNGCTNLASITIPDSVKTIEHGAFNGCTALETVKIGNGVTDLTGFSFRNSKALKEITIGNGIESIESDLFYGCSNLTNVRISNSVKSIGDNAFENCTSLRNITIPNSVKNIGDFNTFRNCINLVSVSIPDSVKKIGNSAFEGCTNLTNITIGGSVKLIDRNAFKGCTNIANITIPKSVRKIEPFAFYECSNLKRIAIPSNVKSIGDYAFENCKSLDYIKIPDSVVSIGSSAFYGTSFYYNREDNWKDNVLYIGKHLIKGIFEKKSYKVKKGTISIADEAFEYSTIKSITIPNTVKCIGDNAFKDCKKLKDVYYLGLRADWKKIAVNIQNAKLHCKDDVLKTQKIKITKKEKTISSKKLKKGKWSAKLLIVKKAKGKVTYKIIKNGTTAKIYKKVSINKKGVIALKKGKYKKGVYNIKISVKAAGNSTYQSKTITKTIKIKVI